MRKETKMINSLMRKPPENKFPGAPRLGEMGEAHFSNIVKDDKGICQA